jgi:multidrug efflux pump subunit AcrA (membrane-fusion protein)
VTRTLLISGLLFLASVCGCRGSAPSSEPATAKPADTRKDVIVLSAAEQTAGKIDTQNVDETSAPDVIRVSGRIARADDRTWRVGVRTVGVVDSVLSTIGSSVKKGDIMARYHADEARELRAQYRRALADLRAAESAAATSQRTAERYQTLLGLKAASVQQVDQAQQDLAAAQAKLRDTQVEADRAKEALEHDLHVSAPTDAAGDTSVEDEVPIIAPASGYVLEKNITPGKTVELSTDAFVIGDLSTVWMLAAVRQDQLASLRTGQTVTVSVPGLPGESFVGTIANLGQELDPQTRMMPVRISLPNANLRLKPEMLATADLPIGSSAPRVLVPSDAVQQVSGQDVVFVKTAADRFVLRAVRIGPTTGGRTPILEGLKAGEQIVTKGSFVLKSHLLRTSIEGE